MELLVRFINQVENRLTGVIRLSVSKGLDIVTSAAGIVVGHPIARLIILVLAFMVPGLLIQIPLLLGVMLPLGIFIEPVQTWSAWVFSITEGTLSAIGPLVFALGLRYLGRHYKRLFALLP